MSSKSQMSFKTRIHSLPMKRIIATILLMSALAGGVAPVFAQDGAAAQKFEYAMVKWDGPDRIQYILPDKFEMVHLGEKHPLPKGAQGEEFYLTRATNELAKQGWEAVNINSRRILLRRPLSK